MKDMLGLITITIVVIIIIAIGWMAKDILFGIGYH